MTGPAKKNRNPSRFGDRKARPVSARSVLAVVPKTRPTSRCHMNRVAARDANANTRVAIVTGCTMRSKIVESMPLGSADDHEPDEPEPGDDPSGTTEMLRSRRCGLARCDLRGNEHPHQPDRHHEERHERFVQAGAELADRREATQLVDHRDDGDDEGQVVHDQRQGSTPPAPLGHAERRRGVGDEAGDGEQPEEGTNRARELVVARAARQEHHDDRSGGTGDVPAHHEPQPEGHPPLVLGFVGDLRLAVHRRQIDHQAPPRARSELTLREQKTW